MRCLEALLVDDRPDSQPALMEMAPLACRTAAALVTSGFMERLVECCTAAAQAYRGSSMQVGGPNALAKGPASHNAVVGLYLY